MQRKGLVMGWLTPLTILISGCVAGDATMPTPKGVVAELGRGEGVPEVDALTTKVTTLIGKDFSIIDSKFFKENGQTSWSEIQLSVANERDPNRKETGGSPKALTYDSGSDLINVYPANQKFGAFAVAMSNNALADGTKLVGYYELKAKK